jgi:hypothetical protein
MAKWEIHARLGFIDALWWKFMPGVVISVKWPFGIVTIDDSHPRWDWSLGSTYQEGFSSDPNDHYRPWLEKHVGRQGWDWNWQIGSWSDPNNLKIKFRRKKADHAIIAALLWA